MATCRASPRWPVGVTFKSSGGSRDRLAVRGCRRGAGLPGLKAPRPAARPARQFPGVTGGRFGGLVRGKTMNRNVSDSGVSSLRNCTGPHADTVGEFDPGEAVGPDGATRCGGRQGRGRTGSVGAGCRVAAIDLGRVRLRPELGGQRPEALGAGRSRHGPVSGRPGGAQVRPRGPCKGLGGFGLRPDRLRSPRQLPRGTSRRWGWRSEQPLGSRRGSVRGAADDSSAFVFGEPRPAFLLDSKTAARRYVPRGRIGRRMGSADRHRCADSSGRVERKDSNACHRDLIIGSASSPRPRGATAAPDPGSRAWKVVSSSRSRA